jgi:hypothetical protein
MTGAGCRRAMCRPSGARPARQQAVSPGSSTARTGGHRLAHPAGAGRRLRRSLADSAPVAYEFKLPDLGEGLTEGEIARWLVEEGRRRRDARWSRSRPTRRRSRSCPRAEPSRRSSSPKAGPGRNGSGRDRRRRRWLH